MNRKAVVETRGCASPQQLKMTTNINKPFKKEDI